MKFDEVKDECTSLIPTDDGLYNVQLHIGHQTFTIDMGGSREKKDANWYRKQITHALLRFKQDEL